MSGARLRTARAARKGVCARASGPAPRGARSTRAPQRAREQEVLGARSRSAQLQPPLPPHPSPQPGPPASHVPHLHVARARECARTGGDGAEAWEGAGARGPCRSAARAGRPRPSEQTPEAPPPSPSGRRPGEQRDALGLKGRSRPRLRTWRLRWHRAGNNPPAHPQPRRNVFPQTKYPSGDPIKDRYR